MLFADVQSTEPGKLTGVLIHSLTHLYFRSPYAWLQEGVPSFMGSLWLEQNRGRDVAIQQLDNDPRSAFARRARRRCLGDR